MRIQYSPYQDDPDATPEHYIETRWLSEERYMESIASECAQDYDEHYAAIVRDKAIIRALILVGETMAHNATDHAQEPREQLEDAISAMEGLAGRFGRAVSDSH